MEREWGLSMNLKYEHCIIYGPGVADDPPTSSLDYVFIERCLMEIVHEI